MKEKNRFSKPVAFNSRNADDQQILSHVKRRNFSGYVKKLILADIKEREQLKTQDEAIKDVLEDAPKKEVVKENKPLTAAEKMAKMKKEIEKKPNNTPGPKMFN